MSKEGKKSETFIRFGMCITYRCNAACNLCNRYLDKAPWPDSDLSPEDIERGFEVLKAAGITVNKVRLTGGEPLCHPHFVKCLEAVRRTWGHDYIFKRNSRVCVFTNNILHRPTVEGFRYNYNDDRFKKGEENLSQRHKPYCISPADLGLKGECGTTRYCHRQYSCGRLFDAFGFAGCVFSGPIGRVLGIDPYSAKFQLKAKEEICRHCIWSLRTGHALQLLLNAEQGNVEYPTKTYKEGFERWESEGPPVFAKFGDR